MTVRYAVTASVTAALVLGLCSGINAQTVNGAIVGVVQDTSGAVVPDVALTLRNIARDEIVATMISGPDGSFAFRNLAPAKYEVQATKDGFNPVSLPDVEVTLGSQVRVAVTVTAGAVTERVEVFGGTSVLGTTATQEHGISPETLNQLPLQFGTGPRAAATFAYTLRHPRALEPAIVTTIHGGKQEDIYARARRHLRVLGDCAIVVSENGRDALVRGARDGDLSQRVHVVAPGRDLSAFTAVAEGRVAPATVAGVPDDARVVLHAGRLAPLKGQRYLLDAWARVAPRVERVVLVIAGSGELEAALRRQARALDIDASVVFAGFRTDLPALLARADLFVLSSLWEGLPIAAVEAMAAARAVVATRAGGTPEVVVDDETGVLAPPGDAPALACAIERVLADADLRRRLARAGRHQAQRYSLDALLSATLAVYASAWERRQRRNQQALALFEA